MKHRFFACLTVLCLLFCAGCQPPKSTPSAAASSVPARSLLVVPFDTAGAQCFLVVRLSETSEVAITPFLRETVFQKNTDGATLYALFADGGAVGFSRVTAAFCENGVPIDRILSVRVDDADSGLYPLLAATGNNLSIDGTAWSASALRRRLVAPCRTGDEKDYAAFRGTVAGAVVTSLAAAFGTDPSGLFSALLAAGHSSFVPADEAVFAALCSPSLRVRVCPVF